MNKLVFTWQPTTPERRSGVAPTYMEISTMKEIHAELLHTEPLRLFGKEHLLQDEMGIRLSH